MKQKKKNKTLPIVCTIFLFLGTLCLFSAFWYKAVYGSLGFDAVIYTLLSDVSGVSSELVIKYLLSALLPSIIITSLLYIFLFSHCKRVLILQIKKTRIKLYPIPKTVSSIISVSLSIFLILAATNISQLSTYIKHLSQVSTIFEDKYVTPSNDNITFPKNKQNLICIYLESMETSFFSKELGGGNDVNAIPELYELANQNINFSNNSSVGGALTLSGSTWTIGALVSYSAGMPLKLPLGTDSNDYGKENFLPGATTLYDILHQNGYYQAFMVGSDSTFGCRKQLFLDHNIDKIYDLYTAREDGIIDYDYEVWWGMEDYYLFEYAKKELVEISKRDEPFAFNMLTVDTHHVGGYVCDYCGNQYAEQYENVLACSSRQVNSFIDWITAQDFYENTTIIIVGDHPTMDAEYITNNIPEDYQRKVYNCFINTRVIPKNAKNRTFCTLDIFPTILASIGCEIKGERLGLGTNLFSNKPTLCEEIGTDKFQDEISSLSKYYLNTFY